MNSAVPGPLQNGTLGDTQALLWRMLGRLEDILDEPGLLASTLVEITAIFNNASYLFLYLEANDHVDFEPLLPMRDAFYRNPDLDARILAKLRACRFDDPRLERSRTAYMLQLEEKGGDAAAEREIEVLKMRAKRHDDAANARRLEQIKRLGIAIASERPSTIFYHVLRQTENPSTREKLSRAWSLVAADCRNEMATAVDEMIAVRRRRAAEARETPLDATLRKCRVNKTTVLQFLDKYLERAIAEHKMLEAEIAQAVGVRTEPIAHFSYFLRQKFGRETAPMFDLDGCLNYICSVAKAILDLDFSIMREPSSQVIVASVSRRGEPLGRINFDLWANHGRDLGANHTLGLRNRASWGEIVQRPEAWVSCRFEVRSNTRAVITFQNVHSLYHEFGHAINHLLVREEIPNQSGLEYLPLERLEYLSMWFEKWAYHPAFGQHLGLEHRELRGLKMCQEAKKAEYRRTYLERAICAILDFQSHCRDLTLRECFDELQQLHGIERYVEFNEFPPYFIWPMYMANPGASFVYLWGASWSCDHFSPLVSRSLPELANWRDVPAWLDPCFQFELPSVPPDPGTMFDFYKQSETQYEPNTTGFAP